MRGKKIIIIGILILIVAIIGTCFYGHQKYLDTQKQRAAWQEYMDKSRPYRDEVSRLQRELMSLNQPIANEKQKMNIMIGFAASEVSDISYIQEKAAQYLFEPILVLDVTMDIAQITELLQKADPQWEIMLYPPDLSEEACEKLEMVKSHLESMQRQDCGIVFYRAETISQKNMNLLKEQNFIGYTLFHDSPLAGQNENGLIYFDYSRLSGGNTSLEIRLSSCYTKKSSMIYVFDMPSIQLGNLAEKHVNAYLDIISEYSMKENSRFVSVAEVIREILENEQKKTESEAILEEEKIILQNKIDELQETIRQIYTECYRDIQKEETSS